MRPLPTAALPLLLSLAVGCGSHGGVAPVAPATVTPDAALPTAAGRQSSGRTTNDLISGESTASTTSQGGIYVVRHGFYLPPAQSLPSGTN